MLGLGIFFGGGFFFGGLRETTYSLNDQAIAPMEPMFSKTSNWLRKLFEV